MIQYPLQFKFKSHASAGSGSTWKTDSDFNTATVCAIPPEFEGPGGGFSPEDFFGLAVLNCFVATFKVIAEKSKLDFKALEANASLTVDRDEKGAPWMKSMTVQVTLTIDPADQKDRAQRILEKTSQSCIVARSIKTDVQFELSVVA